MLVVSFIRHGESLDNLKSIWAGHKDAELSELGVRQSRALGEAYANIHLDAIITSDLKRAHATAVALLNGQPNPKPSFGVDLDLREQNFGDAEGNSWLMHRIPNKSLDDHFKDGQYPTLFERHEKFPNGESMNDVAVRAERFINNRVLRPYLTRAVLSGANDVHVAVVSHGLYVSELIPVLLKQNGGGSPAEDYKGLLNTAWTRVTVQIKPGVQVPQIAYELEKMSPLAVTVTDVNRHEHTNACHDSIVESDPKQRSIREFFGGGGAKKPIEGLEHAERDVMDGVKIDERD